MIWACVVKPFKLKCLYCHLLCTMWLQVIIKDGLSFTTLGSIDCLVCHWYHNVINCRLSYWVVAIKNIWGLRKCVRICVMECSYPLQFLQSCICWSRLCSPWLETCKWIRIISMRWYMLFTVCLILLHIINSWRACLKQK